MTVNRPADVTRVQRPAKDSLRARADELGTSRPGGGFRCKASIDDASVPDHIVTRAVARAKEGDREAVRFLYLRYADNVYSYVRSIVRDDYEAEDITQHVFAKLITVIGKYEQRAVPFSAWIIRLSHNVAIDHIRARRAIPAAEVFGPDERAEARDDDRFYGLRSALEALPDEQRDVVVLRHVVGLSPGEIAERLGRSESSVHGLHHRGRRALQAQLAELELIPSTAVKAAA
jgi:RNA polymerase sigma-70 factor (ECF subfamily)